VQALDAQQVLLERFDHAVGQNGDAIFVPLRVAHDDGAALEVEILDAQTQAFQQAQNAAIEQFRLTLIDAGELGDDLARLVFREHLRQVLGRLGPDTVDGVVELPVEHHAI